MKQKTCAERVKDRLKSRLDDLRRLWTAESAGYEGGEFNPATNTNGDECPVCLKGEAMEADENTSICKPCWDELADLGTFHEYGLAFDYVKEGTFEQDEAYFRYQLSWGGPSDEFRFYVNPGFTCHRIEYWFLDWFDGAEVILEGEDYELLEEIFEDFKGMGAVSDTYDKTKE